MDAMDVTRAPDAGDETPGLLSSAVGDRCSSCGAPLASDQRYCVNCGTRRGKPRFTVDPGVTGATTRQAAAAMPPKKRGRQPTSSMMVIGFIGVLLLAMGVGVLIGHNGNSNPTQVAGNQKPLVVTVGGGGAVAATPTTSATTTHTSSGSSGGKGKAKNGARNVAGNNANGNGAAAAKHIDKKTADAAASAAAKALGSGPVSNPTVQPGQAASGPGTENGKFTGHFFPGGQ
jgi:hypothetical protein